MLYNQLGEMINLQCDGAAELYVIGTEVIRNSRFCAISHLNQTADRQPLSYKHLTQSFSVTRTGLEVALGMFSNPCGIEGTRYL